MSALDGFFSTWSKARETFGQGTPQTGEQYDKSGALTTMQTTVQSASPGSKWTGAAASAYDTANTNHAQVLGKLAGLDQQLSAQVTQSAQVVEAGRKNLDAVRQWVVSAAASVPDGKNRDQLLLPIAQKGISQVTDIVTKSNADLNQIGGAIKGVGAGYDELKDQKLAPKEGVGDNIGNPGDQPGDQVPPPVDPAQAEHDVHQVLAGTATPEELARVKQNLSLSDAQMADQTNGNKVQLTPQQQQVLGQMQAQMHGMSIDDIQKAEQRLGDDKWVVGDSLQMMSNPQFDYAKVPLEVGALGSTTEVSHGGGLDDQLPTSFHNALNDPASVTHWEINSGFPTAFTDYPTQDDLHKIAGIVQDGHESMQSGSYLDHQLLEKGSQMLQGEENQIKNPGMVEMNQQHVDPTVQDIFSAAGRDSVASHDLLTNTSIDSNGQPHGQNVLENISKHDWQDDGQAARKMTDWIDDAAKSDNPVLQERAGETAHAIANVLGNPDSHLLHLPTDPAGLGDGQTTVGQRNPALMQGFSEALQPFQTSLVGDDSHPGFAPLDDPNGSNMPHTKALFAAMDSDPTAAKTFNAAAFEHVNELQQGYAAAAGENPDMLSHGSDPRVLGMQRAGLLAGMIEGGAVTEAHAQGKNEFDSAKAAYDLKKDALGYMVGLGTDKVPVAGGLIDAMGKDAFIKNMLGGEPTLDENNRVVTHGVQDYRNIAVYSIASEIVGQGHTGALPPQEYLTDNGHGGWTLKPPEQISEANRDEYYGFLYEYLQSPQNANVIQSVDQFNQFYDNGRR